ncbi:hypothetical protein [Tenacibaculum piscium]|uniref:hypothetical protein n=1 Tax=Tenacibaculum piscium TaxID=1458515 RepID=UPI001F240B87|nr:hypothetical protein [Tenacibaculum piscium]
MNLGILNETVILIDTDFLNERINYFLSFYKELYPNKAFEKINLADLLYKFAINARVEEAGHNVDIIFAHTLSNSSLTHCEPSNLIYDITSDGVQMETDIGNFLIRSFFAGEDETCIEHFNNMLQIADNSSNTARIVMITDNEYLNSQLEYMDYKKEKVLFMIKKYYRSEITVPIKYVKIDNIIGRCLGLNNKEL